MTVRDGGSGGGARRVRRGAAAALRAALAALAALQRIAPRRARRAAPELERAGATPVVVGGGGVALRAWRMGDGPAVLLLHGREVRSGQLLPLARALARAGCSPVAIEAPARGSAAARTASVSQFADALEVFARAVDARLAVGHALGGAAVALAAARGLPLDAAVVLGVPRSPAAVLRAFGTGLCIRGCQRPPALVVHDRADAAAPFADATALADAWGADLVATHGLGDQLLRDGEVIARVVAFVTAHFGRCACGRVASSRRGVCAGCELAEDLWDRTARRRRVGG